MRRLLLFLLVLPVTAQIVSTPTQATATAGTLVCVLTRATVVCTAEGKPYITVTPPLELGKAASGSIGWSGDQMTYALTMYTSDGAVRWFASVTPLGGITYAAAGVFAAGPVTVGTLVGGVCRDAGTGAHVVPGVRLPPPDGTLVTAGTVVFNETGANCVLP